jgi:hypothetical protein
MTLRGSLLVATAVAACVNSGPIASAQETSGVSDGEPAPVSLSPVSVPLNQERILKIIPDYQTVQNTSRPVAPLTVRQKWNLAWKETTDPFNVVSAAMTAAFSQRENQTPKYGEGWPNYGKRFGAAVADMGTQSLFSAAVFATLLRQDPRYFRKGPGYGLVPRALYSVTRLFVGRNDAGRHVFNSPNLLGMAAGIAASNLYYPSASRTGAVMAGRLETSLLGGLTGNLMSEFWPDVQRKLFHRKTKN